MINKGKYRDFGILIDDIISKYLGYYVGSRKDIFRLQYENRLPRKITLNYISPDDKNLLYLIYIPMSYTDKNTIINLNIALDITIDIYKRLYAEKYHIKNITYYDTFGSIKTLIY